ncbi:MAG: arginine deiminase-related protein [Pseudomonadota bacterium]
MQTFLMCEPRHYEVNYVINPWMAGNEGCVDKVLAARQWQTLYDVLAARATIRLIEPVAGLPDMVFTANGGLVYRDREVIVSSFRHTERQPESQHFGKYFTDNGYRVRRLDGGVRFEGAGDALYDVQGRLWFGYGHRSDAKAGVELARILGGSVIALELADPRWYHLDTAFCPLANGHVLAYAPAFSRDSVGQIRAAFGERVIWATDADAHNFVCNAVNIGADVILHRASDALKAALYRHGCNVIELDMSEFMKAGGSCKCLTLAL